MEAYYHLRFAQDAIKMRVSLHWVYKAIKKPVIKGVFYHLRFAQNAIKNGRFMSRSV
jgi:hypothetical protein